MSSVSLQPMTRELCHQLYRHWENDESMFNTRKQENNSTWKENKLGLVFSSKDLITFRNNKGEDIKRIGKREWGLQKGLSGAGGETGLLFSRHSGELHSGYPSAIRHEQYCKCRKLRIC